MVVTNSRSALSLASIHPILSSTHALQIQKRKHVVLWPLYPLLLGSSSHAMRFLYASVPPNIQYLCQWRSNTEFTTVQGSFCQHVRRGLTNESQAERFHSKRESGVKTLILSFS